MSFPEIWGVYLLPIIQFLIGPIITGLVIFRFTNNSVKKQNEDEKKRQVNVLRAKLERMKELINEINKELENRTNYEEELIRMKHGDFSGVKEELDQGSEDNVIKLFESIKLEAVRAIGEKRRKVSEITNQLNEIPYNLLPPEAHYKLMQFIESKKVSLDMEDIDSILKKLK